MKTMNWMKVAMMCVAGAFVFTSCDDDDKKFNVPEAVQGAFTQKYGDVGYVEWDRERRNSYIVAEFRKDNKEQEAWFKTEGTWVMTEVDWRTDLTALPQPVQDKYNASEYTTANQWRVDDIDQIIHSDGRDVYVIEVEKGGQPDTDLHISADGQTLEITYTDAEYYAKYLN